MRSGIASSNWPPFGGDVSRSRPATGGDALARDSLLAGAIIYGTVLFNAVLALVNANVAFLSSAPVIGSEIILDVAAMICCYKVTTPLRTRCVALIVLLGATNVITLIGNSHLDPKFARDVLIIPVFAFLGLAARREDVVRLILPLHVIILAVMLFEAFRPDEFGHLLNITSYYIHTRGFDKSRFWSKENSDLFVSATRPGARFLFNSLNIHRLSSVFLEPVSLGNYVVIIGIMIATFWEQLRTGQKLFFVASTFVILVGCDGRFATVSLVVIALLRVIAPVLPRYSNVLYLPLLLGVSAFAVGSYDLSPVGDDFKSRTAGSILALSQMDWGAVFGFDAPHAYSVMDSGIAYLLYSQSIIGTVAIWIFISCCFPQNDKESASFAHMASFYWSSSLLVSYSVFSVKTAALLWFLMGAIAQTKANEAQRSGAGQPLHDGLARSGREEASFAEPAR